MRDIDTIIIHCTATTTKHHLTKERLIDIHRKMGFDGCGYHFYITYAGIVYPMRPIDKIGAHCKGYNKNSIGIAYEGGLDRDEKPFDTRTPNQKMALLRLINKLCSVYKIKKIAGHRDFSKDLNQNGIVEPNEWTKQCPCFDASEEYEFLIRK